MTKSVIPFATRFFAALIPETPPPRIATFALVVVAAGAAEIARVRVLMTAKERNFMLEKFGWLSEEQSWNQMNAALNTNDLYQRGVGYGPFDWGMQQMASRYNLQITIFDNSKIA